LTPSDDWRKSFVYEAPTPVLGTHPVMAVRDTRWKLIRTYETAAPEKVAFTELYDLENDPHEMTNLAADAKHEQRIAAMVKLIEKHDREIRKPGG
jgi:arylsulfatase A-like enzyme